MMRNVRIWASDLSRGDQVGHEQTMPWFNSDGVFSYPGGSDDVAPVSFKFDVSSTLDLTKDNFTFSSSNPWLVEPEDVTVSKKGPSKGSVQTFELIVIPVNLAVGSTTINVMAGGR